MRTFRFFVFLGIFFFGCSALTSAATNHPKILIIYDMEGVSGVTHYEMLWFQRPDEYAKGRESLTSDVNAAIRGLAAGGAGSIWIQDGHGSGNGILLFVFHADDRLAADVLANIGGRAVALEDDDT